MAARNIRKIIACATAPKAIGPYSQAVGVGNTFYLSGQVGINRETGSLVTGGIEAEAHQALKNIGAVLKEEGMTYSNVVKCTVLLASMEEYKILNGIYAEYFTEKFPARAAFAVAELPLKARVEIECIAVKDIEDV